MRAEEIIIKALKRAKRERGLRVTSPSDHLSGGHVRKADHNLVVMTDLSELGHEDWTVIAAYYAMYQSALAILTKIGLESKEHATTAAVLEYFFGKRISRGLIEKFDELKGEKDKIGSIMMEEKYIDHLWKVKRARETAQYGISIECEATEVVMNNAREFASKVKLVVSELDDKLVAIIGKEIRELEKAANR